MKSPMVTITSYIKDKESYSGLRVLRSAAGYYIGTIYTDKDGFEEPGSRDSGYFKTHEAAEIELAKLESDADDAIMLRMRP